MSKHANPQISLRKNPKQARSNALMEAVLEAAVQVLVKEGAARFTTARVAEKAGVSVGSLYQYFPNKAAILFRLQSDEWKQTTAMCRDILADTHKPPLERLRILVHAFIQSECDESEIRGALDDATPLYWNTPEAQAIMAESDAIFEQFMQEALPQASHQTREMAGNLIVETLTEVGKNFSEPPYSTKDSKRCADAMADMFCAYITMLANQETGVKT